MYSRPNNRDVRLPPNYGGSMFDTERRTITPVEDLTRRSSSVREDRPSAHEELPDEDEYLEDNCKEKEHSSDASESVSASAKAKEKCSLLSPLGQLGTEELLLLALALIIFQGGKEPELALILLVLLFIN